MARMRICVLIPGFGIGGAQKQCIYLLNELQKDTELDIHVIYFYEDVNFEFLNQAAVHLHPINVSSFYNPGNIVKVLKVIRRVQADVLFSWLPSCDVYAYFITRFARKTKWVMSERDSHYPPGVRFRIRNIVGKRADLIIPGTAVVLATMELLGARRLHVSVRGLRYGVLTAAIREEESP